MPKTSIFLHKSVQEYADLVATVVDTSRSEIISDCISYIKENIDENKVWEDYDKKLEALEDAIEEADSEGFIEENLEELEELDEEED